MWAGDICPRVRSLTSFMKRIISLQVDPLFFLDFFSPVNIPIHTSEQLPFLKMKDAQTDDKTPP